MTDAAYHKRIASVRYPITERDGVPGRECRDCDTWKPLAEFYRVTGRRTVGTAQYLTRCKTCHIAVCSTAKRDRRRDAAWAGANRDRRGLRRKALIYRIPEVELLAMLATGCAICGGSDRLHIDHDHERDVVRGVLCRGCNHGLGNFRDDPELLGRAVEYLAASSALQPRPPLARLPSGRRRKEDDDGKLAA